jgi:hypothetical protein
MKKQKLSIVDEYILLRNEVCSKLRGFIGTFEQVDKVSMFLFALSRGKK